MIKALVDNDYTKAKIYITSSYGIIGIISLVVVCLGNVAIGLGNWNYLLNISEDVLSNSVLIIATRLIFTGIMIQFFLKLVISILHALQKTALSNFLSLLSSLLVLIYVLCFNASVVSENLINLSTVYMMTVNIPLLIATIIIFSTSLKDSRPHYKYYVKKYAYEIVKLGGSFFVVQIAFMIITSTNDILITWLYGSKYVVEYQIYQKIFFLFVTIFSLISNPVWSAITKAYAEKRFMWIWKMYKLLNYIALCGVIGVACLIAVMQPIVNIWLGEETITISVMTSLLFALIVSIMLFILSVTCIANGIGELKSQIIFNILAAVIKVPLAVIISNYVDNWSGIIIVNIIVMLPAAIGQPIIIKRILRRRMNQMETM